MGNKKRVKAKTGKASVSVSFILDKSGSMQTVESATISGFNEYIGTLKKEKDVSYDFALTLFDTDVSTAERSPIKDVAELTKKTYSPSGNTALYDAVCKTVAEAEKAKKGKNLVVIMTDGEENSSKEFTEKHLKDTITRLEKTKKWTFVFLGANQDSYQAAQKYGISKMNTTNFIPTSAGTSAAFVVTASATRGFGLSTQTVTDSFFSQEQQNKLEEDGEDKDLS